MIMELKPCPFCGGNAYISLDEDAGGNMIFEAVICRECGVEHYNGIDSWNTRHTPEGYALVPIEPTEKMIQAGLRADNDSFPLQYIYKAMIDSVKELD